MALTCRWRSRPQHQQETSKLSATSESIAANSALNDSDDYVRLNFSRHLTASVFARDKGRGTVGSNFHLVRISGFDLIA
jgi:hypothetical protein